jgi:ferredoxin
MRLRLLPAGVELPATPGQRVLDLLDEGGHAGLLPLRCRAANCATCLVRVRAGAAALAPPDDDERELLERLLASAEQRLGCQLRIANDSETALVELSVVAPPVVAR